MQLDNKTKFSLALGLIIVISAAVLAVQQATNKKAVPTSAPVIANVPDKTKTDSSSTDALKNIAEPVMPTQAEIASIKTVRSTDGTDHVQGSTTAPVQIIVYSDFDCEYCATFAQTLAQAKQDYLDKVTITFRHFPLVGMHASALPAANASECAGEQGKFWEMYNALYAATRIAKLGETQISDDAKKIGLDMKKYNACIAAGKYNDKITKQAEEAKTFNVIGAPTAFINGQIIIGSNPYLDGVGSDDRKIDGIKTIIDRILAQAK